MEPEGDKKGEYDSMSNYELFENIRFDIHEAQQIFNNFNSLLHPFKLFLSQELQKQGKVILLSFFKAIFHLSRI
jgi:hypothetical protein